jgi:hypothetical protein
MHADIGAKGKRHGLSLPDRAARGQRNIFSIILRTIPLVFTEKSQP